MRYHILEDYTFDYMNWKGSLTQLLATARVNG